MPSLKVLGFDGVVPRTSPTLLADNQAQQADNVKLYSRELRAWAGATLVFTPTLANVQSIYKLYGPSSSAWLTWNAEVDVVPGPLADTTQARIYYTTPSGPKKTNYTLATTGTGNMPRAELELGVPAPAAAPSLSVSGSGSGVAENRVYIYTYVSEFAGLEEEGPPSPPTNSTVVTPGQTVAVSGFSAVPAGSYNITKRRIYRSVAGASTDSYQFVAEIPLATTSYNDTLTVAQLGEVIPSINWTPPPATLKGLVSLPNGSLAGFVGNTVYFSEPFYAHAWPIEYALSVPYNIVGLGTFGTSVVVLTERYPYVFNGAYPGSMTVERVPMLEPCVSKASIVSDEYGVVYASPNGLVVIGPTQREVITKNLFRRGEWQAALPAQIRGAVYDGKYFAVYPTAPTAQKSMVMSRDDIPALSYISVSARAVHIDDRDAKLFYVDASNNRIYELDSSNLAPLNYEWTSKRYFYPQPTTWSVMRVDGNFDAAQDAASYNDLVEYLLDQNEALFAAPILGAINETTVNGMTLGGSTLLNVPQLASARSVQVLLYGDGELKATISVTSARPIRLPAFKSRDFEFKIVGNVDVRSISFATTVAEVLA